MSKKLMMLFVVLAAGVLLTGCTWFDGDEEAEDTSGSELENVEVVDDDNANDEDVAEIEDIDEEEDMDEDSDDDIDSEEDSDDEEDADEDEAVVDGEGAKTIGSSMAEDGAVINGYSYEVAGGKLNFEWKVDSTSGDYPQATAVRDSDNTIIVTYPSLARDSVAKEEETTSLGTNLPDLTWMPSGSGSKYEFEYSSPKDFELLTEDRGEEGKFIIVSINF